MIASFETGVSGLVAIRSEMLLPKPEVAMGSKILATNEPNVTTASFETGVSEWIVVVRLGVSLEDGFGVTSFGIGMWVAMGLKTLMKKSEMVTVSVEAEILGSEVIHLKMLLKGSEVVIRSRISLANESEAARSSKISLANESEATAASFETGKEWTGAPPATRPEVSLENEFEVAMTSFKTPVTG